MHAYKAENPGCRALKRLINSAATKQVLYGFVIAAVLLEVLEPWALKKVY